MQRFNISGGQQAFHFYENNGSNGAEASQTVKLSADDKQWLNDISSANPNPEYGASTIAREAIQVYRYFYQVRHKLWKYRKSVSDLLESLP